MKRLTISIMTALLLLLFIPSESKAVSKSNKPSKATSIAPIKSAEAAEANILLARLDEIKAMDKSTLNATERKALRKEVRSIKSQLSELGGGVYLSVGAIIIIILLLILIL